MSKFECLEITTNGNDVLYHQVCTDMTKSKKGFDTLLWNMSVTTLPRKQCEITPVNLNSNSTV